MNWKWWIGGILVVFVFVLAGVVLVELGWLAWNSPLLGLNCRTASDAYLSRIEPDVRAFRDTANLITSAPSLTAPIQIEHMQGLARSVEIVPAPECAKDDMGKLIAGMRGVTNGFLKAMDSDADQTRIRLELAHSVIYMAEAIDGLSVQAGRKSPVAFDPKLVAQWRVVAANPALPSPGETSQ